MGGLKLCCNFGGRAGGPSGFKIVDFSKILLACKACGRHRFFTFVIFSASKSWSDVGVDLGIWAAIFSAVSFVRGAAGEIELIFSSNIFIFSWNFSLIFFLLIFSGDFGSKWGDPGFWFGVILAEFFRRKFLDDFARP